MALRRYTPKTFTKLVASSSTPEFLHDNDIRMYGLIFIAEKAVGTENAGDVFIQIGGADAIKLEPGRQLTWPQPPFEAGYLMPQDFKVRVSTNNAGVRVIYNELT